MLNSLKEEAKGNTEHTFILSGLHSHEEIRPVISEVLEEHAAFAYIRFTGFEKECRTYESEYGMDSEEFLKKFESGELGDDPIRIKLRGGWENKYLTLLKKILINN